MYALSNPQPFDRETVRIINFYLKKDREEWLPRVTTFSVGDGADGFVFVRSQGTYVDSDESGLTPKAHTALQVLNLFGGEGARFSKWQAEAQRQGLSPASSRGLVSLELVVKAMDKYLLKPLQISPRQMGLGSHPYG
jgi:hypothetical protein